MLEPVGWPAGKLGTINRATQQRRGKAAMVVFTMLRFLEVESMARSLHPHTHSEETTVNGTEASADDMVLDHKWLLRGPSAGSDALSTG